MGRTSRDLYLISLGHMFFIVCCFASFQLFKVQLILFMPLVLSIVLIATIPPRLSIGVLMSYIVFDGMLKIFSGYHPISHVGADILVILMTLRALIEYAISPPDRNWVMPPLVFMFIIHLAWVTVQVLNPYGTSVFAGIAAYKVYMTFILLYFISYLFLRSPADLRALMWIMVAATGVQIATSIYQFEQGDMGLLSWSTNYSRAFGNRFIGDMFRPFGTSAVPGGGSTWIFLTVPILTALFFDTKNYLYKLALAALFILGVYVLFICQVRSAMLKGLASILFMAIIMFWRKPERVFGAVGVLALLIYLSFTFLKFEDSKYALATRRLGSLADMQTVQDARSSHFESFLHLWENAPLGIGLSRVGAAGSYFQSDLAKDKFFGPHWSFADNLYLTLVVELGFPGLIFFTALLFGPFGILCYRCFWAASDRNGLRLLVVGGAGLLGASIIGHFGSEGSLYLPECACFWLFLGATVRFSEGLKRESA
jgi:hypothetical protein